MREWILLVSLCLQQNKIKIYFSLTKLITINKLFFQMENTSSIGYKTFASQFFQQSSQGNEASLFQRKAFAIKKNKLSLLHSLGLENKFSFSQKNQKQLTLLHYAAYFNSPGCALYLLYRNVNMDLLDKEGKSVFHLCAYTGHVDVMIYVHEFWKTRKIKELNDNFLKILTKAGFKRTDAKSGKLKIEVSHQRQGKFLKVSQQITKLYKQYLSEYSQFILKGYQKPDKQHSRNCFHYASLNKYQRCLATLQYMVKSLHNQDLVLSEDLMFSLNEVEPLVEGYIDPRQLEDALGIMKEFVEPHVVKGVGLEENQRVKSWMEKILAEKDKDGHNSIYLASKTGSAAIVALLKKLQAKYAQKQLNATFQNQDIIKIALNNSARGQITDLCEASKNADVEIINFLISCGQEVNKKKSIFGTFALLQAIKAFDKEKNIQPIKILMKSGADINEQDSNGWTIFHHIAEKGYVEILKHVFHEREQKRVAKLSINKTTNKGYHPLHIAAMNDQTAIIEMMMKVENVKKHQIDTNPFDQQKATILHYAAKKGCLKTMKKILAIKGRSIIGMKDVNDNTCLHLAAANNHTECVREIIYFDSDYDSLINVKNKKGKLAKDLTLKKKCFESVFTAAREGDVNTIRNLANQKPTIIDSHTPIKIRTPLILSVMEMQLVNVKFLVDLKADQYHQDAEGKTAAQYAQQLQELYMKKDKSKIPTIKKIRAMLD